MGAVQKVEGAVLHGGVVEGHPQHDGGAAVERVVGVVHVPVGGVGPRLLVQGVVVVQADGVDPGELGRHPPKGTVENQPSDRRVALPQVHALGEHVAVVVFIRRGAAAGLRHARGDGLVHRRAPSRELGRIQQVVHHQKAALAVGRDLRFGQCAIHQACSPVANVAYRPRVRAILAVRCRPPANIGVTDTPT